MYGKSNLALGTAKNHFFRQSRARLKGYLVAKVGGSQLEKLLSLLIESGAIYSAIWVCGLHR